ncbi:MAG: hypothetical protein ACQEWG_06180 [Bacteroidota bacterium]
MSYKITIPERMPNSSYYEKVININGEERIIKNEQPEYYSINDIDFKLLKAGFVKIENLAYSNQQLESINDFFINNYSKICKFRLIKDFDYNRWLVYKRYDDILFYIYEAWGADMKIDIKMYLFPFLGGLVDVSDQIKFDPENFDFEYQFHLYNTTENE